MCKERNIIIATVVFLLFGMLSYALVNRFSIISDFEFRISDFNGSWSCTADLYVCPDGREVGRVPPYCHFTECQG